MYNFRIVLGVAREASLNMWQGLIFSYRVWRVDAVEG